MHRPTFRQLQIFSAVAKHKSFTRAAEELFLTQSSVSAQIKQLTDIIGHPLFEQKGKRIKLTNIGEQVLVLDEEFEQSWRSFEDRLSTLSDPRTGDITVSCVNTCQYFFPRILGDFYKVYPEIRVSFRVFNRQHVMQRLQDNRDDLYIMDYLSEELDVKAVPFVDNPIVIVASPQHRLAGQSNIPLDELEQEVLLVREPGSGTRRETDKFFSTYGIEFEKNLELGSSEAIKQGVIGELGISVLSKYAVALELDLGILVSLNVQGFPLMRKWNIAYPAWKSITPPVRTLLDYLKQDGRTIASNCLKERKIVNETLETIME